MSERIRTSIAKKLLIHLYVISTSVAAVITVATSYADYSRESKVLQKDAGQLSDLASRGVSALLWNRDTESMSNQLGSILENPMVYRIDVTDDTGARQFSGVAEGREAPKYSVERAQDINYDDGDGGKVIGKISFIMSEDKVVDGVFSRFLSVLLLNGLKAIIVSTLLFIVLKRLVTRPIEDLVRHFRKAEAPTSKNVTIDIHDRKTSYDEMSELLEFITIREKALPMGCRRATGA